MPKNWSYPYFMISNNFVPVSLIALGAVILEILIYCLYVHLRKNSQVSVKFQKNSWASIIMQMAGVFLLFAFAQMDDKFILYKAAKECTAVLRQLDLFVYAVMFLLFLGAIQYKNPHTYINRLIKYLISINQIEIMMFIFQNAEKGKKGFLSLKMQIVFAAFFMGINIGLMMLHFVRHEVAVKGEINQKEHTLYELRQIQLYEIRDKIRAYTKKDQLTIFISDEWGGGKTFFAKALCRELNQENYITVWIDLLDFNDKEAFITQILKRIGVELEEHNYYTGRTSEFEGYLNAILKISLNESVAGMIAKKNPFG